MKNKKCSECEYAKKVTMPHTGIGASSNMGSFSRDELRCQHPDNEEWYKTFTGKTHPRHCPLN